MKNLIRKKSFAVTVMIVLIFASILLGGSLSIKRAYSDVEESFYKGSAYTVQANLEGRIEAAQNMIVIGKQFNKLQDSQVDLDTTATAIDNLRNAKTPSQKYEADRKLDEAVIDLYLSLRETTVKDANNQSIGDLYSAFNSADNAASIEAYNDEAKAFNDKLGSFPTNFFASMADVHEMPLFE